MRCAIWYYLYNLKNMKNTHGRLLLLVKFQAEAEAETYNFTKGNTPPCSFHVFLNCTNCTKSGKAYWAFCPSDMDGSHALKAKHLIWKC